MTPDITPGTYRNTNTGVHFELELDDEENEVIIKDVNGASDLEIRKPQIEFYINTQAAIPDDRTPTYELVESVEAREARENETASPA